jgi:hypothetical protein|nr:MAG TPA: hypothetical protein [Caudoviricetes sp.]
MEEVKIGTPEQHVQGEVRINEKSDFPLAVRLVRDGQEQPWPQVDFKLKATVDGCFKEFLASRVGEVFTHCRVDGDRLLVFFDNHGLKNGLVRVEVTFSYPDSDYSTDGLRQETFSATSNIRLVRDSGDALSLKLPEPKVVEKVVEKIVHDGGTPLPEAMKAFTEAPQKVRQHNADVGAMELFNDVGDPRESMAAEALLQSDPSVLQGNYLSQALMGVWNAEDKTPYQKMCYAELARLYLQCGVAAFNVLDCQSMFSEFYATDLQLVMRNKTDFQNMFIGAYINRLSIYLTGNFDIAVGMNVSVDSNSSHEDWVSYRSLDQSSNMTSPSYGGRIQFFTIKFDADKMEQAITMISKLGFGVVEYIIIEHEGDINVNNFAQWLLEALPPYTDTEKEIKTRDGLPLHPYLMAKDDNLTHALSALSTEYAAKGYIS